MKLYKRIIVFLFVIILSGCEIQRTQFELPSIISDNMVLQQKSEAPIWGWANEGESIAVTPSWGEIINLNTNDSGEWMVNLNTPEAGGPYTLLIEARDTSVTIKNIFIGEVWLCSGQSNMEMPLAGWPPNDLINNSDEEIKNANNPLVRMFTVKRAIATTEKNNCIGDWKITTPETAPKFSATAYLFGKELHEKLDIPIGLIHSSWGGTPAESWVSGKSIETVKGYEDVNKNLSVVIPQLEKYNRWLDNFETIVKVNDKSKSENFNTIDYKDSEYLAKEYDDSKWKEMTLPIYWEKSELGLYDGAVLFRKSIKIPKAWIGKKLMLELGPIDDMDQTYVNGVLVGESLGSGFWNKSRAYEVDKKINNSETLTIVVRAIDTQGGGGIYGKEEELRLYVMSNEKEAIPLSGQWKYLPVAEFANSRFHVYESNNSAFDSRPELSITIRSRTPTVLYNGMIAPLVPYKIKGAIWYQGESNVGRAEEYVSLFSTMIKSWRAAWGGEAFPFYYTQIAPYSYSAEDNSESAELRAAQFEVLQLENSGMISTLDIGVAMNIHPGNKQDVGKRLALWALAKDYDKEIVFSGPLYKSMKVEGKKIRLKFDSIGSGLVLKKKKDSGFIIAGENGKYYKAKAIIDGDEIVLYSQKVKNPKMARYSWNNVPTVTLFNKEGLPAPTFKTDFWKTK